jgi:hypothetical protein
VDGKTLSFLSRSGAELVARRIAEARQSMRGRGARALSPGTVPVPELFDALEVHS